MEHTLQQHSNHPSSSDSEKETSQFVNLRPFLRLRLGLFALALAFALLYLGGMTFGNGTIKAPEPTDPEVARAAWQKLVSETLAKKSTADQPVSLPTSKTLSIGLLPIRVAGH